MKPLNKKFNVHAVTKNNRLPNSTEWYNFDSEIFIQSLVEKLELLLRAARILVGPPNNTVFLLQFDSYESWTKLYRLAQIE